MTKGRRGGYRRRVPFEVHHFPLVYLQSMFGLDVTGADIVDGTCYLVFDHRDRVMLGSEGEVRDSLWLRAWLTEHGYPRVALPPSTGLYVHGAILRMKGQAVASGRGK